MGARELGKNANKISYGRKMLHTASRQVNIGAALAFASEDGHRWRQGRSGRVKQVNETDDLIINQSGSIVATMAAVDATVEQGSLSARSASENTVPERRQQNLTSK